MARWHLATACTLVAATRVAAAAPTREVRIETTPPGAKIYFNSKEDGEVCTTPCTVKAPVGDTPIIIEAEKYRPMMEVLEVTPRGGKTKFSFAMTLALGNIIVDGPRGATIYVDDEEQGTAPATISVEAAPHNVVLKMGTKQIYADSVDVQAGADAKVSGPKTVAKTEELPPGPPNPEDTDLGLTDTGEKPPKEPAKPREGNYVAAHVEMDVAFRSFSYDNGGNNLSGYTENGHVVAGPAVEVWPGVLAGVHALRGLAIYGRAEFNLTSQTVTQLDMAGKPVALTAKSSAQIFEISARHRWRIGDKATVEVSGGYIRDRWLFSGKSVDVNQVPNADYSSIRIGARGSLLFDSLEPYLAVENRIVLDGGPLGSRFYQHDASGLHAALGATKHFGAVQLRAEAAITRYAWTFKANSPDDMYIADGATDLIFRMMLAVGYAY